jgi:hypothetical protein
LSFRVDVLLAADSRCLVDFFVLFAIRHLYSQPHASCRRESTPPERSRQWASDGGSWGLRNPYIGPFSR